MSEAWLCGAVSLAWMLAGLDDVNWLPLQPPVCAGALLWPVSRDRDRSCPITQRREPNTRRAGPCEGKLRAQRRPKRATEKRAGVTLWAAFLRRKPRSPFASHSLCLQ